MNRRIQWLASLKLTVFISVFMVLVLAAGTIVDPSVFAIGVLIAHAQIVVDMIRPA